MALAGALALMAASRGHSQVILPATPPQPVMLAPAAPDPVRMELARKLVEASGGEQQVAAQMKAMMAMVQKGVTEHMPPAEAQLAGPIYEGISEEMVRLTPRMLELTERAYAENFSESELRDLLAFQTSETGQAMVRKLPQIRAQVMNETMPMIMAMLPEMMRKAAGRACEVKHCTAKERAMVSQALDRAMTQRN
jgi:hypothetical protein